MVLYPVLFKSWCGEGLHSFHLWQRHGMSVYRHKRQTFEAPSLHGICNLVVVVDFHLTVLIVAQYSCCLNPSGLNSINGIEYISLHREPCLVNVYVQIHVGELHWLLHWRSEKLSSSCMHWWIYWVRLMMCSQGEPMWLDWQCSCFCDHHS